jgi:hypothetical protein
VEPGWSLFTWSYVRDGAGPRLPVYPKHARTYARARARTHSRTHLRTHARAHAHTKPARSSPQQKRSVPLHLTAAQTAV